MLKCMNARLHSQMQNIKVTASKEPDKVYAVPKGCPYIQMGAA
jgi:hypothetical protein